MQWELVREAAGGEPAGGEPVGGEPVGSEPACGEPARPAVFITVEWVRVRVTLSVSQMKTGVSAQFRCT